MKFIVSGGRYRHQNCLDMDLEVERLRYTGPTYIVVNVAYLNRHWQGGEFLIHREKNLKIMRKDFGKWTRIK